MNIRLFIAIPFFRSISKHIVPLHHQTTRKMVKRWTVGQSHFLGCAEGPSCEAEAFPERLQLCIITNVG